MPTIKKDENPSKNNNFKESDLDEFLQAFQKPTQIYTYIKQRNSKLFLQRTLSYMVNHQMPPSRNSSFKVNGILGTVEKSRKNNFCPNFSSEYLNLKFWNIEEDEYHGSVSMHIKVYLLTLKFNKRKSEHAICKENLLGSVLMPGGNGHSSPQSILIHSDALKFPSTENYSVFLSFVVVIQRRIGSPKKENESPIRKRLRRSTQMSHSLPVEPELQEISTTYYSKIPLFDRKGNCQLKDGDYELQLIEEKKKSDLNGNIYWTPLSHNFAISATAARGEYLKVQILWSQFTTVCDDMCPTPPLSTGDENSTILPSRACALAAKKSEVNLNGSKNQRIYYQFLYHNKPFQQTMVSNFACPWCQLNCRSFSPLLCHLRNVHSRFNFAYIDNPNGGRIDVSINESYDCTYSGNPQNLLNGSTKGHDSPRCRISSTQFIMYRPKCRRMDTNGGWFNSDQDLNTANTLQISYGHNRQYYHSISCQPLHPSEVDVDSESEHDPEWLRLKMMRLVDEFTDVNEGEKEIMKMWNLHCMKNNYVGKCQMWSACDSFVSRHGAQIIEKNLFRNLTLHLACLHDYDLLTSTDLSKVVAKLLKVKSEMG